MLAVNDDSSAELRVNQVEVVLQATQGAVGRAQSEAARWHGLYRAGAVAALIAVLFFRRNMGAELIAFRGFGLFDVPEVEPQSALEWFTLLQEDKLVGLTLLGLVDLVNYLLVGLIFLAVYGALRRANPSAMIVAMACSLVGIAVYLASNQAFALLSLSGQFAAAATDSERAMFLAAGEALLAINEQGTGTYAGLFLMLVAGLILSLVMLRSRAFGRSAAWLGIVANAVGLLYFPLLALFAATVMPPALLAVPFVISAPFREVWYLLIGLRLFRLASGTGKAHAGRAASAPKVSPGESRDKGILAQEEEGSQ